MGQACSIKNRKRGGIQRNLIIYKEGEIIFSLKELGLGSLARRIYLTIKGGAGIFSLEELGPRYVARRICPCN